MSVKPDGPDCPACGKRTNVSWGWDNEPVQKCPHCGVTLYVGYEDSFFDGEATWPCWALKLEPDPKEIPPPAIDHDALAKAALTREIGTCDCTFRDARCAYVGPETSCNKTAKRCRELGNLINFRAMWPKPVLGGSE